MLGVQAAYLPCFFLVKNVLIIAVEKKRKKRKSTSPFKNNELGLAGEQKQQVV